MLFLTWVLVFGYFGRAKASRWTSGLKSWAGTLVNAQFTWGPWSNTGCDPGRCRSHPLVAGSWPVLATRRHVCFKDRIEWRPLGSISLFPITCSLATLCWSGPLCRLLCCLALRVSENLDWTSDRMVCSIFLLILKNISKAYIMSAYSNFIFVNRIFVIKKQLRWKCDENSNSKENAVS